MMMTKLKKTSAQDDEQSIGAAVRLPGLEIDLWHRRLSGETPARFRAMPSFDAFGPCLTGPAHQSHSE